VTALLGHLVIQEKARRMYDQRRAFCLAEGASGGSYVPALAAGRLAAETGRPIVVLTAAGERGRWSRTFAAMGYEGALSVISIQQHSATPALLRPDAVLVLDGEAMTCNIQSVSWRHFAPVVRAADAVFMVLPMELWPSNLVLAELVSHYDHAIPLWRREVTPDGTPH
jgi:hypothetical protein